VALDQAREFGTSALDQLLAFDAPAPSNTAVSAMSAKAVAELARQYPRIASANACIVPSLPWGLRAKRSIQSDNVAGALLDRPQLAGSSAHG